MYIEIYKKIYNFLLYNFDWKTYIFDQIKDKQIKLRGGHYVWGK